MDFDFTTETITPDVTSVLTIGGTGGIEISVGTTAERPVSPVNGTLRYNIDDSRFEVYQESAWVNYTDALYLPGSTFKTIQDYINILGSRGTFSGGEFADNGNGTISVTGGTGMIHPIDDVVSPLYFFNFATVPSLALTDNAKNYIFVDYNGGSPQIIATVTPNFDANFVILGQVYRSGTTLTINNWTRLRIENSIAGMINRFETVQAFQHENGGILSAAGTRNFAITAGVFWEGIDRITTVARDTSVSDTFTYWYRDTPTTWVSVPSQTQINNTQYNNPSSGLAALTNNRYGSHWVYVGTNGSLNVIYGITDTSLSETQDSQPPQNPPNDLLTAVLIGRIIIQKNSSTFTEVQSAFDVVFTGGATSVHNELGGLQGGTAEEYYHTTARENSLIVSLDTLGTGILAKTSPTTVINRTLTAGTGISITNGDGVAGNPTISATGGSGTVTSVDVSGGTTGLTTTGGPVTTSGTITLTGTLATTNGGTGRTTIGTALQVLRVNAGATGLEYATPTVGTVTSVAATQPAAGLTITGSPITSSGTLVFALANDLLAVENLATNGMAARTGTSTWTTRTVTGTAGNITVTNGDGVAGNPTLNLATLGTPVSASFVKITTDTFGRISATTPVVASDITGLVDTTYVNVTGDTMSGNLTMSSGATVTGIPTPTNGSDAVNRNYVDAAVAGLSWKQAVRAGTIVAGTLASSFENGDTIDGVVLATGDRILIKNQASQTENGIYVVNVSGAPTRATDADTGVELVSASVYIDQGTTLADTGWVQITNAPITIGVSNIVWSQFTGAAVYTAGTGLTLGGNQFSLTSPVVASLGGTGQTTYVVGDILYASATNALSRLADVATGNSLISGGVGVAPSWGKIGLTTHVSGTLATTNGGTGLTTIGTALQVLRVNAGATGLEYATVSTSPAAPSTSVQWNNAGVFGGNANFVWNNTTNTLDIIGTIAQNRLRVGGTTDVGTSTVYIETNNTNNEGQRVYFNSGTPATSGYISYAYDASTPYISITDADDDPTYVTFNTIGSGTFASPQYLSVFGSRGTYASRTAGAQSGFSWYIGANTTPAALITGVDPILELDSQFLRLPTGSTAARPGTPTVGMSRYNTTLNQQEYYNGTFWRPFGFSMVQIIIGNFTAATGTSAVPYDGTIPGSGEGTEVWTQAITPSSTSSRVKLELSTIIGYATGDAAVIISLFRGTTNIGSRVVDVTTVGGQASTASAPVSFTVLDTPATVSAVTYSLRIGATSGAWYFGRSVQTLGGASAGNYTLTEIL